ncbi:LADA_0D10638g1_1 [Lachancea dasiensis]|uniref:LADA_0D10638g1_1 n=1 Tax=Lachancea dasiensis TaxID=1072105 RepID=A0A1G4J7Z3_9SACH|nr:LADA_0D10638g1_1 [Lachancea dasiensis]
MVLFCISLLTTMVLTLMSMISCVLGAQISQIAFNDLSLEALSNQKLPHKIWKLTFDFELSNPATISQEDYFLLNLPHVYRIKFSDGTDYQYISTNDGNRLFRCYATQQAAYKFESSALRCDAMKSLSSFSSLTGTLAIGIVFSNGGSAYQYELKNANYFDSGLKTIDFGDGMSASTRFDPASDFEEYYYEGHTTTYGTMESYYLGFTCPNGYILGGSQVIDYHPDGKGTGYECATAQVQLSKNYNEWYFPTDYEDFEGDYTCNGATLSLSFEKLKPDYRVWVNNLQKLDAAASSVAHSISFDYTCTNTEDGKSYTTTVSQSPVFIIKDGTFTGTAVATGQTIAKSTTTTTTTSLWSETYGTTTTEPASSGATEMTVHVDTPCSCTSSVSKLTSSSATASHSTSVTKGDASESSSFLTSLTSLLLPNSTADSTLRTTPTKTTSTLINCSHHNCSETSEYFSSSSLSSEYGRNASTLSTSALCDYMPCSTSISSVSLRTSYASIETTFFSERFNTSKSSSGEERSFSSTSTSASALSLGLETSFLLSGTSSARSESKLSETVLSSAIISRSTILTSEITTPLCSTCEQKASVNSSTSKFKSFGMSSALDSAPSAPSETVNPTTIQTLSLTSRKSDISSSYFEMSTLASVSRVGIPTSDFIPPNDSSLSWEATSASQPVAFSVWVNSIANSNSGGETFHFSQGEARTENGSVPHSSVTRLPHLGNTTAKPTISKKGSIKTHATPEKTTIATHSRISNYAGTIAASEYPLLHPPRTGSSLSGSSNSTDAQNLSSTSSATSTRYMVTFEGAGNQRHLLDAISLLASVIIFTSFGF